MGVRYLKQRKVSVKYSWLLTCMFILASSSARITKHNKGKRELIMHCDLTLFSVKNSKQTKMPQVRRIDMEHSKRRFNIIVRGLSNYAIKTSCLAYIL